VVAWEEDEFTPRIAAPQQHVGCMAMHACSRASRTMWLYSVFYIVLLACNVTMLLCVDTHSRSHRHIVPIETFAEVLDSALGLNGDEEVVHAHLDVFATGFLRRWVDYVA
jgi:hypothetical protein